MTPIARRLEELPDDELIPLCIERGSRDDRPFSVLFRRHSGYVGRVARGLVPGDLVDDVTQEVFVSAYTKLGRFERRASFRTWLHTLTVNRCKNTLRGRKRRDTRESACRLVPSDSGACGARRIEVGVQIREVSAAFSALPRRDQDALRLVGIEERPYAEVSEQLGISLSALKMRVARARRSLRMTLGWSAT